MMDEWAPGKPFTNVLWHPASDVPENPGNAEDGFTRYLIVVEGRLYFGFYIARANEWKMEGSPSKWEIEWWANPPKLPQ